jgi:hypothetical protein
MEGGVVSLTQINALTRCAIASAQWDSRRELSALDTLPDSVSRCAYSVLL